MAVKQYRTRLPSVASSRAETSESATIGSRQRQSKKDEAIRRKIEQELSKKRQSNDRGIRHGRKIPGTVSALRPTQALTVKERLLVMEASQLMAAKRGDCVLVVDENEHLSGIFTAKDIAYRVVAANVCDPRTTTVADIMTKMPMCVTSDTSAQDALNLMVSRGFRHLPVCNEEGDIFGLLDITKCLYGALDKMERAFGSSQKLYDALAGVEREWSSGPAQLTHYMNSLRDRMSCPDLNSVMDGQVPAKVNVKTNVREVARLMKERHTTAVLVTDREGLAGIFTTKDIVLRVVAAGISPDTCSVVRVMTPNPDCADPQTTIMEALRRMNVGHYLNLPVMEEGSIVGMVDVLKLTYATLEQINSIQGGDGEGPMWSRFWDSFGENEHMDTESQLSDAFSASPHRQEPSPLLARAKNSVSPDRSSIPLQEFPEITPNESASMTAHTQNDSVTLQPTTTRPSSSKTTTTDEHRMAFKYKLPNGQNHRFALNNPTFQQILECIQPKMMHHHMLAIGNDEPEEDGADWLTISYVDDENDQVLMTSDSDLRDAMDLARKMNQDRVMLHVVDSKAVIHRRISVESPTTPTPALYDDQQQSKTNEQLDSTELVEDIIPALTSNQDDDYPVDAIPQKKSKRRSINSNNYKPVAIAGIPQELILPAAITFLGLAVLGVFAFSGKKSHYH